jgi:hypothetical protein
MVLLKEIHLLLQVNRINFLHKVNFFLTSKWEALGSIPYKSLLSVPGKNEQASAAHVTEILIQEIHVFLQFSKTGLFSKH